MEMRKGLNFMKNVKKAIYVMLAICMMISLFAGCKSNKDAVSSTAESSKVSSATTSSKTSNTTVSSTSPVSSKAASVTSAAAVSNDPIIPLTPLLGGKSGNVDVPGWDAKSEIIKTAHSLEVGWAAGYGKGFLIDGKKGKNAWPVDFGTYASCTLAADKTNLVDVNKTKDVKEFIQIKLPEMSMVSKISLYTVLRSKKGFPKAFTLEVSEDGTKWTKVHEETKYFTDDFKDEQPFAFAATKALYIKINITEVAEEFDPALKFSVILGEIEVYGKKA